MTERPKQITFEDRRRIRQMNRTELKAYQLSRFNSLIEKILPDNQLYRDQLSNFSFPIESLEQLSELPFTYKDQLLNHDESGDFAANLTFEPSQYCRFHRTSGTQGRPLVVLDTAEDWEWWIQTWQYVLDAADISPNEKILFAFSFGPFIGFWSAFDAAIARGCMCIPSGGLSTVARLELIQSFEIDVVFCTPSYALHMAEVAAENQINTANLGISKIVVAGEPGGSIPEFRERIESTWNAKVIDHSGASEIGPWGFPDAEQAGLFVNEAEFIAEFLSVDHGEAAGEGELSEIVLTCLGRAGSPLIRYRTGDLVRPFWRQTENSCFVHLRGGVLGRTDNMMIIRGVNIFPSAIEQILRTFPEVIEYRMIAFKHGQMDQLKIEIEDRLEQPERVAQELQTRLGFES